VRSWGPLSRAAVLHSAAPERAAALALRIAAACGLRPIVVDVTTAIGAHVGPGSLGVVGLSSGA
jgi:fatty acid-binding protein DegV